MATLRRSNRLATTVKELELKPNVSSNSDESELDDDQHELEIDDEIPNITLKNQDDKSVSLKKLANENKIIVIFVYPKASTPGCTRQACGFRDNYKDLEKNALILGLSTDKPPAQKKFKVKQNLPYDLLCDPTREFIGLLGAKKTPNSGTIRSHFIFKNGKLKIKKIKVSPELSISDAKKEVSKLCKD